MELGRPGWPVELVELLGKSAVRWSRGGGSYLRGGDRPLVSFGEGHWPNFCCEHLPSNDWFLHGGS